MLVLVLSYLLEEVSSLQEHTKLQKSDEGFSVSTVNSAILSFARYVMPLGSLCSLLLWSLN